MKRTDKAAERAMLEALYKAKIKENPEAVTLYAAEMPPSRARWKPKPIERPDPFQEELERLKSAKEQESAPKSSQETGTVLSVDDFPDLLEQARRFMR